MTSAKIKACAAALAAFLPIGAHCATLQEQNLCSLAAERMFKKLGYTEDQTNVADHAHFMSHYNEKTQQCFLGLQSFNLSGHVSYTIRQVFDAIGGQLYADYMWHTVEGKKYWEVRPQHCEVTPLAGEKVVCESDDEFDALTKTNFGIFFK